MRIEPRVQFPLRRHEGEPVMVRVDGVYQKADLLKLFWSLAVAALDFNPNTDTPASVIRDSVKEFECNP